MKCKDFALSVYIVLLIFLIAVAMVRDMNLASWQDGAGNTLRCGEKGAELVERPIAEGLVTTAKFIVCKK